MRSCIKDGQDKAHVIQNYRKDGTTFWHRVQLAHIKDAGGHTFLILALQTEIQQVSFFLLLLIFAFGIGM